MKLMITRHGETEHNKLRIFQGCGHGKLTCLGKEQAQKLARRLKDEEIDVIFSSDLKRAVDTAKEIARSHPKAELIFTQDLRERDNGDLEDKKAPEDFDDEKVDWNEFFKSQGGEGCKELFERAEKFLRKVLLEFKGKKVLLVSHGGIGKSQILALLNKSWKDKKDLEDLKNTSLTVFEFDENNNSEMKVFNCTKHLDEEVLR